MNKFNSDFEWPRCPQASSEVQQLVDSMVGGLPLASELQTRMLGETGTRLIDWVDHLCVADSHPIVDSLAACGFKSTSKGSEQIWRHDGGMFPPIRVGDFDQSRIAIKVESVVDFLFQFRIDDKPIEGAPASMFRQAVAASNSTVSLWIVERNGSQAFRSGQHSTDQLILALVHEEAFVRRKRDFMTDEDGFAHAHEQIDAAVDDLGVDWACSLFFAAERRYWQSRNRAAQIQKSRQDRLGLGWANHDHHTYRSSRQQFARLIELLEKLGFQCRERFYGGAQAGWGAQVLEQPVAGIVIFADVDLTPQEVAGDFAHQGLAPGDSLGTVGLWCQLHGEAILQAGMHHLECQFDFDAARSQLLQQGVATMNPFTDFEHLKQAFTEGENWQVSPERIESALRAGWITAAQADRFRQHGSIGSHLEILQRDEGYKGFNQTGISEIIRQTDPRQRKTTGN